MKCQAILVAMLLSLNLYAVRAADLSAHPAHTPASF